MNPTLPADHPVERDVRTDTCPVHGGFESTRIRTGRLGNGWTRCPTCDAREAAELEQLRAARERELAEARGQAQLEAAGIPSRFRDRTLDTYEATLPGQQFALEFARDYARGFADALRTGRSALFLGSPGAGKTHLAIGIALYLLLAGYSVQFVTALRLFRRIKESWGKSAAESEAAAIAAFTRPDLLIVDEVGVQNGSAFEANLLFDVLNTRYEDRKPALLLSNLPQAEVVQFLGERVLDRLREDSGRVVVFDWPSHRAGGQQP